MQPIQQSPKHAAPSVVPVAIYTRVSTLHQVGGRFDSCESQAAICRDYIRKRAHEGWTEFSCHTDAAYSGGSMNRPGLQRALSRILLFSRLHHDARVFCVARVWHGRQDPASVERWPFMPRVFPSPQGDDTHRAGSAA